MKKIAVITSTRAEYGILHPLIKKLKSDAAFDAHVIVSGTHLLERYGSTIQFIRQDGIDIAYIIKIYEENFSGSEKEAAYAAAQAVYAFSPILEKERYDAVIVLGDRYELLGFCTASVIFRIPIIHIHGGEITRGAIDDKIRHAVTKLASVHFPALKEYADRIIQMGENPAYVFPVGAMGIDAIANMELLPKEALFKELDIQTGLPVAIVTYHPVTNENPDSAAREMVSVMEALRKSCVYALVTMPNSDAGSSGIYDVICQYAANYPCQVKLKKSLGQLRYLSMLKNADLCVGNSSSGIIETASFNLPTVDIGERQSGRFAPKNVIHCDCDEEHIMLAVQEALSPEANEKLKGYANPYGDGNTAGRIIEILKGLDLKNSELISKTFFGR